ncbi:MAG: Transcriptional regulator XRE family [Microgenomates group bacterium GW2011_GWC1_49_7]|nr:MAG: Transcriptional regulator XRE family [Microgenomates group bacterium GW2011_GWC1_49_7]
MKTVGSILEQARAAKNITLEEAEKVTKIRAKFLEAMEADDYSQLPSISYAKGFVKNYSEYLGLDSKTVLAFFRRQTTDVSRASLLPKKEQRALSRSLIQLTPGRFLAIILGSLALIFLGYLGLQYRAINQPASLSIESPTNQLVTNERRVDILGKTDADATVTINGTAILVRSDGKFFDQVTLEPGVNKITIVATSRFGKTTTIVREVGLQLQ